MKNAMKIECFYRIEDYDYRIRFSYYDKLNFNSYILKASGNHVIRASIEETELKNLISFLEEGLQSLRDKK